MKKRLIKIDKKRDDISKKYRLRKNKPQKITKRVENFVYLSNLLTQQKKAERPLQKEKEETLTCKTTKRPMTCRGNRMKICTDMRIMSLVSNSSKRDIKTSH